MATPTSGKNMSPRQVIMSEAFTRLARMTANGPRARRTGDAAGAGGWVLTTADFVPVTRSRSHSLAAVSSSRGREGSADPSPPPPRPRPVTPCAFTDHAG